VRLQTRISDLEAENKKLRNEIGSGVH
jgi:hypothetical protein